MASLRELGQDPGVVAAVIAPWTAPPDGAIELLAAEGLPVVTFSWAWGPPGEDRGALALVRRPRALGRRSPGVGRRRAPARTTPLCLAGDDHVTSRALLATAEELGEAAGDPELVIGRDRRRPSTRRRAGAVAARIRDARLSCPRLDRWSRRTRRRSCPRSPDPPSVVATSRMKTDEGWRSQRRARAAHGLRVRGRIPVDRAEVAAFRPRSPGGERRALRDRSRSRRTTPDAC